MDLCTLYSMLATYKEGSGGSGVIVVGCRCRDDNITSLTGVFYWRWVAMVTTKQADNG